MGLRGPGYFSPVLKFPTTTHRDQEEEEGLAYDRHSPHLQPLQTHACLPPDKTCSLQS